MADADIREERERNGCCPNCGNRLYKVSGGGGVMSKIQMFKRNKKSGEASTALPNNNDVIMTPLTIAGSVERGQCLLCKDAIVGIVAVEGTGESSNVISLPTAQAVPVVVKATMVNMNQENKSIEELKAPRPDNRKEPPEIDLLGPTKPPPPDVFNNIEYASSELPSIPAAAAAAAAGRKGSIGSEGTDEDFDEETALLEFALCNVDADDLASSFTKTMSTSDDFEDDRKPAAKPKDTTQQRDIDMAFLESSTSKRVSEYECPSGMSPDVFFQLPAEMQKELSEHHDSNADSTHVDNNNIDPETLASLPEHIRKEIMEEQSKKNEQTSEVPERRTSIPKSSNLTQSTTEFLNKLDINEEDFENLPEEVKNDIMENKRRSYEERDNNLDNELNATGYDPEMLASLPQDLQDELLENAKREREERRKKESRSAVGAHSVNVPAGYDPDTFEALPEAMKQELLDDAARRAQCNRGGRADEVYDDEDIAMTVQAQPVGPNLASCTYKGDYNVMGKRHGDGELTWDNGDRYVGRFRDGYIDGRGTIYFRDGTEYSGQWRNNRFHGDGTRRFKNGNVYNGNYVDGKRQGQGKCYFANGDMYSGDWKDDTIHGFGRYYYNNGHSFEGMFRNGKRNGRGKYQLTDGRIEIYRYVNDNRAGDGVRWSSNRKKAWKMNGGKAIKRVTLEEAAQIANRCGPQIEAS